MDFFCAAGLLRFPSSARNLFYTGTLELTSALIWDRVLSWRESAMRVALLGVSSCAMSTPRIGACFLRCFAGFPVWEPCLYRAVCA